jgi:hypothetical protein
MAYNIFQAYNFLFDCISEHKEWEEQQSHTLVRENQNLHQQFYAIAFGPAKFQMITRRVFGNWTVRSSTKLWS